MGSGTWKSFCSLIPKVEEAVSNTVQYQFESDSEYMKNKTEDKLAVAGGCLVIFLWLLGFLLSLGLTGVIIWAIIELVQHFVS